MKTFQLILETKLELLATSSYREGWNLRVAFESNLFSDEQKREELKRRLSSFFEHRLPMTVELIETEVGEVGAKKRIYQLVFPLPDTNVKQPTASEYHGIFLNVWVYLSQVLANAESRFSLEPRDRRPSDTDFTGLIQHPIPYFVRRTNGDKHPVLEMDFTKEDGDKFPKTSPLHTPREKLGVAGAFSPSSAAPSKASRVDDDGDPDDDALESADTAVDDDHDDKVDGKKIINTKKHDRGNENAGAAAAAVAFTVALETAVLAKADVPAGAAVAVKTVAPAKADVVVSKKLELVDIDAAIKHALAGIAKYKTLPRTFFSGSHLGYCALMFEPQRGKSRAQYYEDALVAARDEAKSNTEKLQYIYALLATNDGTRLKEEVMAQFDNAKFFEGFTVPQGSSKKRELLKCIMEHPDFKPLDAQAKFELFSKVDVIVTNANSASYPVSAA